MIRHNRVEPAAVEVEVEVPAVEPAPVQPEARGVGVLLDTAVDQSRLPDEGPDEGPPDAGPPDAGPPDAGPLDQRPDDDERELTEVPIAELRAELARRKKHIAKLLREKERLRARIREIDQEVAGQAGSPEPVPVVSPYRQPLADLTVAEAIARVFEIGAELSPKQAVETLLDAGYKSRASNFRAIVTQTLAREGRFKRMARGLYQRTA